MTGQFEVESGGYKIRGTLALPSVGDGKHPCVILSHGLISSQESAKYLVLADVLARAGIASCRFDFQGCGVSEGPIEETTLTIRLGNLEAVSDWVMAHPSIDEKRCGLLGSSFGGSTSLVKAARDERIRCLSLWATPYRLGNKEDPSAEGIAFKEALYTDFAAYDLLDEAKKVSHALVIHGKVDEVVPFSEGEAIYKNLGEPKKLELIEGGDHTFSTPSHRERAISLSLEWFRRFLV
jgi:fermentation-respiration switch protein FrsA (DUF1100 family)